MSGSLPLVLIIIAGIVALCWADLGKRRADLEEDEHHPEAETRIDQRLRQAGE